MEKISMRVGDTMRVFTAEQYVKFSNPRKPTPQEVAFVDAYLKGNQRNSGKAYAIAYARSSQWPAEKRLKEAKKLLRRPSVHKLLNARLVELLGLNPSSS